MAAFRIAVIGAGGIAQQFHLPSLRALAAGDDKLHLAALCDVDSERAQTQAARFGFAQNFGDYRTMLDVVAPDAVWVLTPYHITRQVAGDLLTMGVPTLMEKPPGANAQETRELLSIAQEHGTPHQVAFNRRHAPLLKQMQALLAEKGAVIATSCQFYRHRRSEPTFAFGTGLHGLDTLRFLADDEVVAVDTQLGPAGSALVTLTHTRGFQSLLEMLPQVGVQSERYTAHTGDRTVVVEGVIDWLTEFPGYLRCYDAGKLTHSVDNEPGVQPPEVVSGFYGESVHFIACLRHGAAPRLTWRRRCVR